MAGGNKKRKESAGREPAAPAAPRSGSASGVWIAALCFSVGLGGAAVVARARRGANGAAPPAGAAATAAPRSAASADVSAAIARARQLIAEERLALAETELQEAQRRAPNDVTVSFLLGDVAYNGYRMQAAEAHYRRAAALDPSLPSAPANVALTLLEQGQARAAAEAARQAMALDPQDPRFRGILGQCLLRLGQWREAAALLEGAAAQGADTAAVLAALGRARDRLGQGEAALNAFEQALARHPSLPLTHYWRAECLRGLGRAREAEQARAVYRRALDLEARMAKLELRLRHEPDSVRALLDLARVRVDRGFPQHALVLLRRAERIEPAHPEVREALRAVEGLLATATAATPQAR